MSLHDTPESYSVTKHCSTTRWLFDEIESRTETLQFPLSAMDAKMLVGGLAASLHVRHPGTSTEEATRPVAGIFASLARLKAQGITLHEFRAFSMKESGCVK